MTESQRLHLRKDKKKATAVLVEVLNTNGSFSVPAEIDRISQLTRTVVVDS